MESHLISPGQLLSSAQWLPPVRWRPPPLSWLLSTVAAVGVNRAACTRSVIARRLPEAMLGRGTSLFAVVAAAVLLLSVTGGRGAACPDGPSSRC